MEPQPIATAPKDGTWFIGIAIYHGAPFAATAEWCETEQRWFMVWGWEEFEPPPTHWLPMPEMAEAVAEWDRERMAELECDGPKKRARSRHHHSAAQRRDNTR